MRTIVLTEEQYQMLVNELLELSGYHWNDDKHSNDIGSKILPIIEQQQDL